MNTKITFTVPELNRLNVVPNGVLCLFYFEEKEPFTGILGHVDWRLLGHLSQLRIADFLTGRPGDALLVPLGNRLPQSHLLLIGLGKRSQLEETSFHNGLEHMFQAVNDLKTGPIIMTLPGRPEKQLDASDAIKWFLSFIDETQYEGQLTLIEAKDAQQSMLLEVERWRLKHSVPAPPPTVLD